MRIIFQIQTITGIDLVVVIHILLVQRKSIFANAIHFTIENDLLPGWDVVTCYSIKELCFEISIKISLTRLDWPGLTRRSMAPQLESLRPTNASAVFPALVGL